MEEHQNFWHLKNGSPHHKKDLFCIPLPHNMQERLVIGADFSYPF
jgi:hypothetical protein